jgi:hypothetical protein
MSEETFRPEQYSRRRDAVGGWEVEITSYRLGATHFCHIDNVSPGATIARGEGESREQAEGEALAKARERLEKSRKL